MNMRFIISLFLPVLLLFSFLIPVSANALSGDPTDFVTPKTTKIVGDRLVTQYDIQYKGVVKSSSGFLTKLEVGKLMAKGFRKYMPALRLLNLVDLAVSSGYLFDKDSGNIYEPLVVDKGMIRVITGTTNAVTGNECMEIFNWYLANNGSRTTSANLISCSYNKSDGRFFLSFNNVNQSSSDYDPIRPELPINRPVATSLIAPESATNSVKKIGDEWGKRATDETLGDLVLKEVPVSQLADLAIYNPDYQSPSALRAIEAVKNDFDTPYEPKYEDTTKPQSGIGLQPSQNVSTSDELTGKPEAGEETGAGSNFKLPDFCTWATTICDFMDWYKNDDQDERDTNVDIVDLPVEEVNVDISIGSSECPPDYEILFPLGGQPINIVIPFTPMCDLASSVRIPIIIVAMMTYLYIVTGQREI